MINFKYSKEDKQSILVNNLFLQRTEIYNLAFISSCFLLLHLNADHIPDIVSFPNPRQGSNLTNGI